MATYNNRRSSAGETDGRGINPCSAAATMVASTVRPFEAAMLMKRTPSARADPRSAPSVLSQRFMLS